MSTKSELADARTEIERCHERIRELTIAADDLRAQRDRMAEDLGTAEHQRDGYASECARVEWELAAALGYGLGDEDSPQPGQPVIGDHTPTTLASEAARRLGHAPHPGGLYAKLLALLRGERSRT